MHRILVCTGRASGTQADDWLNYPTLKGTKSDMNCETWGGPDYHRNYLIWWYTRFPKAEGIDPESGLENNWWKYVYQFDQYGENGRRRK